MLSLLKVILTEIALKVRPPAEPNANCKNAGSLNDVTAGDLFGIYGYFFRLVKFPGGIQFEDDVAEVEMPCSRLRVESHWPKL